MFKLISEANFTLAVGAWALKLDGNFIYLKYNLALCKDKEDENLEKKILRVLFLIQSHLNTFGPLFKAINTGHATFDEVQESLNQSKNKQANASDVSEQRDTQETEAKSKSN